MKRSMCSRILLLVAGIVCSVAVSMAGEPINEKRPAAEDGSVIIKNLNGSVTVEGWNRKEIEVTGTLGEEVEELEFESGGKRARIEVIYPRRMRGNVEPTDLVVKLPKGSQVRVSAVNADLEVSKVEGELELETVNGAITVIDVPASIDAQTVNGRIQIDSTCPRVEAQTVSGEIVLKNARGDVSASAVSGAIDVSGSEIERGEFSIISGDIELDASLAKRARLDVESHSGDVVVDLPGDLSADFDLSTFSGDIRNDFGPRARSSRKFGPGKELSFSVGGGDAQISISTFSGDIRLNKK